MGRGNWYREGAICGGGRRRPGAGAPLCCGSCVSACTATLFSLLGSDMRETQRDFESPMQPSTSREVVRCIGGTAALLLAVASDLRYFQNTFIWLLFVVLMHQCGPGEADVCQRPRVGCLTSFD